MVSSSSQFERDAARFEGGLPLIRIGAKGPYGVVGIENILAVSRVRINWTIKGIDFGRGTTLWSLTNQIRRCNPTNSLGPSRDLWQPEGLFADSPENSGTFVPEQEVLGVNTFSEKGLTPNNLFIPYVTSGTPCL